MSVKETSLVKRPRLFDGAKLFELKAAHGLPLDFALDILMNLEGMAISWADFVEAARKNEWWDFQTYDAVCHALANAAVPAPVVIEIQERLRLYMLKHPHPRMPRTDKKDEAKLKEKNG